MDLGKNVIDIFKNFSPPTNEAEAALEAVKLAGEAMGQAKKIKEDFDNNVDKL